jgi:hypothetical protein
MSLRVFRLTHNTRSSAYKIALQFLNILGRQLMYIANKKPDRELPCGVPRLMVLGVDECFPF